ncbi:hypothetical protein [Methylobacterium tarhaniae]|uniref:hypothetical protein n=1 Tax=Methylobacterium tarhaniae TaxID=1187852 RepID=UPI003D051942
MAPRRSPALPILATCLCGALAIARSATGRWFCAEHLPRRDGPPEARAPKAPTRREPAQRDLFRS